MADPKMILAKPLIEADVVDSRGDLIPGAVLEHAVAEFNERMSKGGDWWVTKDFRTDVDSIQGRVLALSMSATGVDAKVEVLPTPQGKVVAGIIKECGEDALELAMMGELDPDGVVEEERDGQKVRVINELKIVGASLVREGTKVK